MEETKTETTAESKSGFSLVLTKVGKFLKDLWIKIFLPALKDVISVSVNRTTQHILYKTPIDQTGPNNGQRPYSTGASSAPWRTSNRPVQNYNSIWIDNQPNRFGVNQVCANDRRSLEDVYQKMQARINDPNGGGVVSVGEMYTYAGQTANSQDYNCGWSTMAGCRISFDANINGYTLMTTEPMIL